LVSGWSSSAQGISSLGFSRKICALNA
jgi:hypothetical protein